MSLTPTTIKNSFIQLNPPVGGGNCLVPQVCLPVVNASDLAFQLTFLATDMDFMYMMQINTGARFEATAVGQTLSVFSVTQGFIIIGSALQGTGVLAGTTITGQTRGTAGGVGTYTLSQGNAFALRTLTTPPVTTNNWQADDMGKMGCIGVAKGAVVPGTPADVTWVMTAAAPTGKTQQIPTDQQGNYITVPEWVVYFQHNGGDTYFERVPEDACFDLYFHYLHYHYHSGFETLQAIHPAPLADGTGQLNSFTCFKKITDNCEGYPTSVLQYANINNAFGFYYDALGQLVDNINFLNSVRLPVYLHSPEQAEDQMSYQKSDGSTLKLSHRIWTDYKLKTDYLTPDMHRALVAATAHDLVFIDCPMAGLSPWIDDDGNAMPYSFTNTPTQLVRTEKIEVDWVEETMPRYRLGQAKGTLRLALAASNINSNCG